jgi:mannose/fructose/N-acetylgalactosamine-specific phosphotransferase system component IIB
MSDILVPSEEGWDTEQNQAARDKADKGARLRERICMALLASPQPVADLIMSAAEVEKYVIGEQEAKHTKAAKAKGMSLYDMTKALRELVGSGINADVQGVVFIPEGMKTKDDPFGQFSAFVIKFKAKP